MRSMKDVTDNIAHDLKTPLTRLQTRVETALRQAEGQNCYKEALEETLSETDHLLRIFNALLRIARIESMAPGEVMERTDINNLINEVSELYEPLVEDEGGVLETQVSDGLEAICQKDLVFQGLVNLIENALKYGRPKDGEFRIRISAEEHEGRVVLSVSDTGPGIPEKDQDRVKDRFVRLDESRSEPGTGLGLSLVKAVARLHGGELQLTNGDPGLVRPDRSYPGQTGEQREQQWARRKIRRGRAKTGMSRGNTSRLWRGFRSFRPLQTLITRSFS